MVEIFSLSGFRLSRLFFSFSSFSDICLSTFSSLDFDLSLPFPGPLLFSFTDWVDPNSLLDLLGGRLTGEGVIMLAVWLCTEGASTCCCTVLSGFAAMATLLIGLTASSGGRGAPGVEARKGGMPGVEDRVDLSCITGEGEGVCGKGERRTTWGEENSSNLAATPAGLGVWHSRPKLGLKEPTELAWATK